MSNTDKETNRPGSTEVKWTYLPRDFYAAVETHNEPEYKLTIDDGVAVALLRPPQDPIREELVKEIGEYVRRTFQARLLQACREFELKGPTIVQHRGDVRTVEIRMSADAFIAASSPVESEVERVERIKQEYAERAMLASKVPKSPELRSMLDSFEKSIRDPDNAFVHLYEIRERLCGSYGNEAETKQALRINKKDWSRFGELANDPALKQGRHRGQYDSIHRSATPAEIDEARRLAKSWILSFAK